MNPRRLILSLALLPIAASAQTSLFSTNFAGLASLALTVRRQRA